MAIEHNDVVKAYNEFGDYLGLAKALSPYVDAYANEQHNDEGQQLWVVEFLGPAGVVAAREVRWVSKVGQDWQVKLASWIVEHLYPLDVRFWLVNYQGAFIEADAGWLAQLRGTIGSYDYYMSVAWDDENVWLKPYVSGTVK